MSDNILQEDTEALQEKIIITDNPAKEKDNLSINADDLSVKELIEFEKKDLLEIANNLKAFKNIPNWKISRMKKSEIAKAIKNSNKVEEKKEVKNETPTNSESALNIVLLQSAVIELVTKKDASKLDLFCTEVVKNNDTELINEDLALKLQKGIVNFSIVHLTIRQLGGYKNIFSKVKCAIQNLKKKLNKNAD